MRLQNKVAIVTGGSQGIGAACVRKFVEEGAFVVVADIDVCAGEALVREICGKFCDVGEDVQHDTEGSHDFDSPSPHIASNVLEKGTASNPNAHLKNGSRVAFVRCDVRSSTDIETAMETAENIFGGIDILVNNAAIQNTKGIMDTSEDEWLQVLDTNLTSVFRGVKAVVPRMRRRGGGAIINTSSTFAIVGSAGYAAYHASKGGVSSFTRAAALDLLQYNIRVNAVCPGTTNTPGLLKGVQTTCGDEKPEVLLNGYLKKQPLGRFGASEEIANVIAFLASGEASFVIGANVVVDGGYTIV